MKLVTRQLVIDAPAEEVFELLVDPALFVEWMVPTPEELANP